MIKGLKILLVIAILIISLSFVLAECVPDEILASSKKFSNVKFTTTSTSLDEETSEYIQTVQIENTANSIKNIEYTKYSCRCQKTIGNGDNKICIAYWPDDLFNCVGIKESMSLEPKEIKTINILVNQYQNKVCGSLQNNLWVNSINGKNFEKLAVWGLMHLCEDCAEEVGKCESILRVNVTYAANYNPPGATKIADISEDIYIGGDLIGIGYVEINLTENGLPITDLEINDVSGLAITRGKDSNGNYVKFAAWGENHGSSRENILFNTEFVNSDVTDIKASGTKPYESYKNGKCDILNHLGNPQATDEDEDEITFFGDYGEFCSITDDGSDTARIYYTIDNSECLPECIDEDGDEYFANCEEFDCDDTNPELNQLISCNYDGESCGQYELCANECPITPEEVCDGLDNDCDSLVDEDGVCGIHDIGFVDFTNSSGGIRIENSNGTHILGDIPLICNNKYTVRIKVNNTGDFYENATFNGSVGNLVLNFNPITNSLAPAHTTYRYPTINFTLSEGTYTINIEAILQGHTDPTPLDNFASRGIWIVCPACQEGDIESCDTGLPGICEEGTKTCVGGEWGACIQDNQPTDEECNLLDDDCNGETDEDILNITTDIFEFDSIGICQEQIESCVNGSFTIIQNETLPSNETCDNLDNNCNGEIDEDLTRDCENECFEGLETCSAGEWEGCDAPEISWNFNLTCSNDLLGVCEAFGRIQCDGTCDAPILNKTGEDENCNLIDENCNGISDDNYQANETSCGIGECSDAGLLECVDGELIDTCIPKEPADEECDALDNNCNNITDENLFDICENECFEGQKICSNGTFGECIVQSLPPFYGYSCTNGTGVCQAFGTIGCDGKCDAVPGNATEEICDLLDNDCDSLVDEDGVCGIHDIGFVDFTNSSGGIRIENSNGTHILGDIPLICNNKYTVRIKVNNTGDFYENATFNGSVGNLVLNFNPITNSLAPAHTTYRYPTINFTLSEGTYTINIEAILQGHTDPTPLDNFASRDIWIVCPACQEGDIESCDTGLPGICEEGTKTCVGGEWGACIQINNISVDNNCNLIDEDCDLLVDEHYQETNTSCGIGECSRTGSIQCINGTEIDNCIARTSSETETDCDNQHDDDCDGLTDCQDSDCQEDEACDIECFDDSWCTPWPLECHGNFCSDSDTITQNVTRGKCIFSGTVLSECIEIADTIQWQECFPGTCEGDWPDAQCIDNYCQEANECGSSQLMNNYCLENDLYSNYTQPVCYGVCKIEFNQILNQTNSSICLEECSSNEDCGETTSQVLCVSGNLVNRTRVPYCLSERCGFNEFNQTIGTCNNAPVVNLISPSENYRTHSSSIGFVYNVTDEDSIESCSLKINGNVTETDLSISKNTNEMFSKSFALGSHTWQISCFDGSSYGNSEIRSFRITEEADDDDEDDDDDSSSRRLILESSGCGDGICDSWENSRSCSLDCLESGYYLDGLGYQNYSVVDLSTSKKVASYSWWWLSLILILILLVLILIMLLVTIVKDINN